MDAAVMTTDACRDGTASKAGRSGFAWTRYGVESGEAVDRILERKEAERLEGGGTFLWGIGNSIRPGLIALLNFEDRPRITFSAMVSRPKAQDVRPGTVMVWEEGVTLDGSVYTVPDASVVTSRITTGSHFALVCESDGGLVERDLPVRAGTLRNYGRGTRIGHSQVTAVVERVTEDDETVGTLYERGFEARLAAPYLVKLTRGHAVDANLLTELYGDWTALRDLRRQLAAVGDRSQNATG